MKPFVILSLFFAAFMLSAPSARAQDALPQLPDPIQNLVNEGAQIRYMGREHGLDSWLTIKGGQEQYFYVLPDRSAFVMGVLFDSKGKLLTVQQVQKLRAGGDTLLDDLVGQSDAYAQAGTQNDPNRFAMQSPSERLFQDIQGSNWVALGSASAPVAYVFIDPQCPHCHAMIEELRKDYLDAGRLQLRMIPVGFKDETRAQAAFLLATPNPQARWYAHLDGDSAALPAKADISQQGVQRNLAIMQAWKFSVTPMIIYRGADDTVKIIRGKPKDPANFVADLKAPG